MNAVSIVLAAIERLINFLFKSVLTRSVGWASSATLVGRGTPPRFADRGPTTTQHRNKCSDNRLHGESMSAHSSGFGAILCACLVLSVVSWFSHRTVGRAWLTSRYELYSRDTACVAIAATVTFDVTGDVRIAAWFLDGLVRAIQASLCRLLRKVFRAVTRAPHRVELPERRDRLPLLAAIAQALLTLLGAAGEQCGLDRLMKTNTSRSGRCRCSTKASTSTPRFPTWARTDSRR